MDTRTWMRRLPLLASVLLVAGAPATAQENSSPFSNAVLTGYGTASYVSLLKDPIEDLRHDFTASISPIMLYSMGETVLFEAEFEFGFEGGQTTTALEYAQIDYLGFERVQFVAGKFLMPFGVFSERLHASWINKLPSSPLIYGHAHGGVAENALLPILSDFGALARLNQPLGGLGRLDLSLWVTQGPRVAGGEMEEEGENGHAAAIAPAPPRASADPVHGGDGGQDPAPGADHGLAIPTISFGTSLPDNNQNKLIGARLGLVRGSGFEVYVSGFHSMYNDGDYLDLTGGALSAEWRRGAWELRGEGVLVRQEFNDEGAYRTLSSPGYYVQAAKRFGNFEPAVRWSQILDAKVEDEIARAGRDELAVGVAYWISSSVPVKFAYAWDPDGDGRFLTQWAFGF